MEGYAGITFAFQRIGRVHAAIIELDALTNAVWPTAEDEDFLGVRWVRFAVLKGTGFTAIGGIHVGRERAEFRRAGIDPFEQRTHVELVARFANIQLVFAGEFRQLFV